MKKEIAEKWVAALRSGRYKQGKSALCKNGKFCCLGVLCDIHRQEVGGEWLSPTEKEEAGVLSYKAPNSARDCELLPIAVLIWADIKYRNPRVASYNIADLNDDHGKNFDEIADLIEKNWSDM